MPQSLKTKYYSIKEKRIRKIGKSQCEICGYDEFPEALEGHHIIPRSKGGRNTIDNCIIVCANCHRILTLTNKSIKKLKEYYQQPPATSQ